MKKLFSLILGLSLFGLPAVPSVFAGKTGPGAPAAGICANRKNFTKEDDAKILAFVQADGPGNWNTIAAELGTGVTGNQCMARYHNHLKVAPGEKTEWNEENDQLLLQKVEEFGPKWSELLKFFPGHSADCIKSRWDMVSRRTANHGRFTLEEDAKILAFVQANGSRNWKTIATELGTGRTIRQCRDRYHNYLEVAPGDKRPWNASEDQLLIEKVNELGPAWTTLRQFFSGYSAVFLKKRWNFIKDKPQAGPAAQSPVQPAQQNFTAPNALTTPNTAGQPDLA